MVDMCVQLCVQFWQTDVYSSATDVYKSPGYNGRAHLRPTSPGDQIVFGLSAPPPPGPVYASNTECRTTTCAIIEHTPWSI